MKDVCTVAEPLWRLTKKGAQWQWSDAEQEAFEKLKNLISTQCMSYFNKEWTTELQVDASPVGLGAVLTQYNPKNPIEKHFVSFASRMLTETEKRYSQCEKEALACVWGPEKFWIYLVGRKFTLITDNRAVKLILNSSKSKSPVPARIERWVYRLTQFWFETQHKAGATNVADYYSRHPCKSGLASAFMEEARTEKYINMLVTGALPPAVTVQEVWEATAVDQELQELIKWIQTTGFQGKLPTKLVSYAHVFKELSVTRGGLVLRGQRLIIPRSLRARIVDLAHGGHQGIVKSKSLIRSRVWFPNIDNMVEHRVKACLECQANSDRQVYEPLRPSKLPEGPWHTVCGDFFGPMEDGRYWFHNGDEYSRWGSVEEICATNELEVEKVLDKLFTTFGAPAVYKSDNGSPFQSHSFKKFAKKWGFKHQKSTPEWPRANAEAESFMKKLGKVLKTAKLCKKPKASALQEFLRAYNETPHTTTGVAPNMLLMGFSRTSGIPSIEDNSPEHRSELHNMAVKNDGKAKARMKQEYDARMKTRESSIRIGSRVLIKMKKQRKSTSAWDVKNPYIVTDIKGSMVTAKREGHTTTRNSSCFKLLRYYDEEAKQDEMPRANSVATTIDPDQAIRNESVQLEEIISKQLVEKVKGKSGRPNKEQALRNKQAKELRDKQEADSRAADPNIRRSARNKPVFV